MADEDAFFEDAVGAYFVGAGLTKHLLNGGGGFFEVVRGVAVAFGCFAVHVLEVRSQHWTLFLRKATVWTLS